MTEIEAHLARAIEAAKQARIDAKDIKSALDILLLEDTHGNSN